MYFKQSVSLSDGQKSKLRRAMKKDAAVSIRLLHSELIGNDPLLLTKTQIGQIERAKAKGVGVTINISAAQIKEMAKTGGFAWASLLPIAMKATPVLASIAGPALGAVASNLINKAMRKGKGPKGKGLYLPGATGYGLKKSYK